MTPRKAVGIMLDDVEKGKLGSKYLYYLLLNIVDQYEETIINDKREIDKLEEDIMTLRELDDIYKQIYDQGYTKKLENTLKRYNLPSGYDVTKNTSALIAKQNRMEHVKSEYKEYKLELSKLKKQLHQSRKKIKLIERNVKLYGKRVL